MERHAAVAAIGEDRGGTKRCRSALGGDYSPGANTVLTMSILTENPKFDCRGAALMLALWALFLLSAMLISWTLDIDSRLTLSGNANRVLEAEAMACSGAEVALHPSIKPGSLNLSGGLGAGKSYEARITGEGGRLDINWLVAGEDPNKLEILKRYLENKGI